MSMGLLLSLMLISAPGPDCGVALEQGRAAMGVYDVETARLRFADAREATCSGPDAVESTVELARIVWRVDGDAPGAVALLRPEAQGGTAEACAASRLLLRVHNGRRDWAAARTTEQGMAEICDTIEPQARLEAIRARVGQAEAAGGSDPDLRAALQALDAAPALARASLEAAHLRLRLGILLNHPGVALDGLAQFYWRETIDGLPIAGAAGVRETVTRGLTASAGTECRVELAELLVRAGFHDEAALLRQRSPPTDDAAWRATDAYLAMRARLVSRLLEHDRARARGAGAPGESLSGDIEAILREGVRAAGGDDTDLWATLRSLWGLVGVTGRSNGVEGLHLGHVSVDEALRVVQGGRSGEVRFVALDNMIANGFSGWLGDGVSGPAGWAADGRIIQVRPRYVQVALDRAALARPGPMRDRFIQRLERRTAAEAAGGDPGIAYLPGLSDRIQLRAIDTLAQELQARSQDPDFDLVLARLWYERSFEGTILLHEGRHILDQAEFVGEAELADAELEYRAKLSELGLSRSPRVVLSTVYGRLIGGDTGHGIANARLLREYTGWMDRNPEVVDGFDPDLPTLVQLDRLTDDQIARIARQLDPAGGPRAGIGHVEGSADR